MYAFVYNGTTNKLCEKFKREKETVLHVSQVIKVVFAAYDLWRY